MLNREKVINGLQCIIDGTVRCESCGYAIDKHGHHSCQQNCASDAIALLKECEQRRRLEVHNIGNVDIPDGVTWEKFQMVMNNVVDALEHTDRGESWPYEDTKRKVGEVE